MHFEVVLYTRQNCSLCRTAEEVLEQLAGRFPLQLEYRDVDSRQAWREAYGLTVPVVFLAGKRVFNYRIDEDVFAKHMLALDTPDNGDHT
jgi:glutaredoxin